MIKSIRFILASLSLVSVMAFAVPVHAEDVFKGVCSDLQAQSSTVCKSKDLGGKNPIFGPEGVLTVAINIISIIVGVVALIFVILMNMPCTLKDLMGLIAGNIVLLLVLNTEKILILY